MDRQDLLDLGPQGSKAVNGFTLEGGRGRKEGGREPGALWRLDVTGIDAHCEGVD